MGYRSQVRNLVVGFRRFWVDQPSTPVRREPYAVPCRCGQVAHGLRARRYQIVRCLACGEPVFVLPLSHYSPDAPRAAAPPPSVQRSGWRLPILAGAVTLLLVVAVYIFVVFQIREHATTREALSPAEQIENALTGGTEALARRDFVEAERVLRLAREVHQQQRDAIPASKGRRLTQLHRQAELLAVRTPRPLELMLRDWATLEAEDLDRVFAPTRGQAVFFDLDLRREAGGNYNYDRRLGPELPGLELHELKLLNRLPLQNAPYRVVFGARLAGLRRDAQNRFVVSFDPDSAVLVTDEEVAASCCPPVEESLRVVLERQRDWAIETP